MQNTNSTHLSWYRQSQSIVCFKLIFILWLGVMVLAAWPAAATTYKWTGGSGTSQRWGDTANWSPTGTPGNGDSLNFGPTLNSHWSPTNDISGLTLNQILFTGVITNYALTGNAFTLSGGIFCTDVLGTTYISNNITLGSGGVTMVVSNGDNLELVGQLSGSGNLTKLGAGTMTYQYGSDNINTGTTYIYGGLLQLNVGGAEAFDGPLVIGDGSGTAATVRYLQLEEIGTGIPITVNDDGVLDLNGTRDTLGPNLTLNDVATIQTETGTLFLTTGTTVTYNAGIFASATISGNLDVSTGNCTFSASSSGLFSGDLIISAAISDSGTIHKTGGGFLLLDTANTFTGLMSVENGSLVVNNPQALGAGPAGTVVTNSALLDLEASGDIASVPLVLASTASGALGVYDSTNIWGGPITLVGGSTIFVEGGSVLSISNAINGTGSVTEIGGGVLEYVGNHQNTYTGSTYVSQGTFILSNTVYGYAIPGALVVGTNCVVDDLSSYQIDNPLHAVTLEELSQFIMAPGVNEWIGPLTTQGAFINSQGTLYLGGGLITVIDDTNVISQIAGTASLWTLGPTIVTNTGGDTFLTDLEIPANLSGETGNSGIIKTGAGGLGLNGVNTFGGSIVVSNGILGLFTSGSIDSTNAGVVVSSNAYVYLLGYVNIGPVPLTLGGSLLSLITNSWAGNITLVGDGAIFGSFGGNDVLTLSGVISGTGGCTVNAPGKVWFSGPNDNTYTGTTLVEQGTLVFNVGGTYAYGGPLVIEGNPESPVVRLAQIEELNQSQPLTITDGTLDLNSYFDYLPTNMVLSDATIESETAFMYVEPNTVATNYGTTYISGNMGLLGNCSFINGGYLDIEAPVSGAGGFFFDGYNGMYSATILASSNSYAGPTVAAGGALWLDTPYSLGTTASSAVVSNNTSLILDFQGGVTNKTLVLNGQGITPGIGNLYNFGHQTNYWAGPITVNGNSVISMADTNTEMHLSGPISGPGGIEVSSNEPGNLKLYLDGSGANTYSGSTIVDAGTVLLPGKSAVYTGIPGPMFISGTVRQLSYSQQMYTQPLTIYDGGLFDLNGYIAYCGQLNGTPNSAITLSSAAEFLPDSSSSAGQTCAFNGVISGTGYIVHQGQGNLTLSNTNSYSNTDITSGSVQVNGRQPLVPVTVFNGGMLCGTGQVANVTCNGAIFPGAGSPPSFGVGTLTVNNLSMSGTASFDANLFGPAPGSYSQLTILGTNNLGGAFFRFNPAFTKPVHLGDTLMLISNVPGPLKGSFNGVVGGTPINLNGYQFIPSYTGGGGNDFTLTDTGLPAGALPGQIIGGNGNQVIDYDECDELDFTITNTSGTTMTGVSAVLSSTTPYVVVTQPYSTYPNIAFGASATNLDWFEISTLPQFAGGTTINLQLTVTSSDGTFVIPFTVATGASVDGGGTCGSCLTTITNNVTGTDPVETGEIKPTGVTSAYGAPKSWPGNYFGNYHYKVFTFTNTLATDAAVTVLVNAGCDVEAVAYVPAFNPSSISNNYAGDAGYYTANGAASFSFDAPAGSPFQIVVNEYTVNAGCSQYTLQLDGLPCPPPTLSIQPASTNTVQLTWPAWAGGFNLENASVVTGPGWAGNTNQPVVTQGLFSVTNSAASTNLFFRLHKP